MRHLSRMKPDESAVAALQRDHTDDVAGEGEYIELNGRIYRLARATGETWRGLTNYKPSDIGHR